MVEPMRYLTYPEGSLAILEEGERLCRELGVFQRKAEERGDTFTQG